MEKQQLQTKARIGVKSGLHLRTAAELAKELERFESDVQVAVGGEKSSLKSVLSVLALALGYGTEVTLYSDGYDAQEALDCAKKYLSQGKI